MGRIEGSYLMVRLGGGGWGEEGNVCGRVAKGWSQEKLLCKRKRGGDWTKKSKGKNELGERRGSELEGGKGEEEGIRGEKLRKE